MNQQLFSPLRYVKFSPVLAALLFSGFLVSSIIVCPEASALWKKKQPDNVNEATARDTQKKSSRFSLHRHPKAADLADDPEKLPPNTIEPPDKNAYLTECEPYRLKIVQLNKKNIALHPFLRPQIGLLTAKHQKCIAKIQAAEYRYLKNASIPEAAPEETTSIDSSDSIQTAQPEPALPPLKLSTPPEAEE